MLTLLLGCEVVPAATEIPALVSPGDSLLLGGGDFRIVALPGDLDDDGIDEVLLSSLSANEYRGEVVLLSLDLGDAEPRVKTLARYPGTEATPGVGEAIWSNADWLGDGGSDLLLRISTNAWGAPPSYLQIASGAVAASGSTELLRLLEHRSDASYFTAAGVDDFDGDGFADLVAVPGYGGDDVPAYLFLGPLREGLTFEDADHQLGGPRNGYVVAPLDGHGDANGDGLSDILIDSRLWYGGTLPERPDDLVDGFEGSRDFGSYSSAFGMVERFIGDVDGDGRDDVVVAAPYDGGVEEWQGAAYLFHSGPTGIRHATEAEASFHGRTGSLLGSVVEPAGDVDWDGRADFWLGADSEGWCCTEYEGYSTRPAAIGAYLFSGASTGDLELFDADAWVTTPDVDSDFGRLLGSGNFDGDDVPDLVVGAADGVRFFSGARMR